MITFNVYDRVFFVRGADYGTAFTIDVENRQYLVSARHVVDGEADLSLFHDHTWKRCPFDVVGIGSGEIDVSVVAPRSRLSPALPLEPAIGDFILGQDVYFVGYPYKLWSEGGEVAYGRPLPFIKKGVLSAGPNPTDAVKMLYVDAINNPGFSGGPLLAARPHQLDYRVIGVVAKFKTETEPVLDSQGEPTDLDVSYNTGFLVAYGMKHVLDLIAANPVGLPIEGPA